MEKGSPAEKYSTAGSQVGSCLRVGGRSELELGSGSHGGSGAVGAAVSTGISTSVSSGSVWGIDFATGFRLSPPLGSLFADHLQPLGVAHLTAGAQPAHPGAVRALSKVHRDAQLTRCNGQAVHVVLVLVGNDDGVERRGLFPGQLHAPKELAATEAGIDEDAGAATGEYRTVAPRPRRQHRETHHGLSIQSTAPVENPAVSTPPICTGIAGGSRPRQSATSIERSCA